MREGEKKENGNSQFREKRNHTQREKNYQTLAQRCKHSPFHVGLSASWTRDETQVSLKIRFSVAGDGNLIAKSREGAEVRRQRPRKT